MSEEQQLDWFVEDEDLESSNEDTNDIDEEEVSDESTDDEETNDEDENDNPDDDDENEDEEKEDTKPKSYRLKTKENHQEVEQEYTEEELISLVQRGKDYDRVKSQAQQYRDDPRLTFVESQAKQSNMTVEQYIDAVNNEQYQDMYDELLEQGVTEALAKEIVDIRRDKNREVQTKTQTVQDRDVYEFVDYYNKVNSKQFDPETDILPDSVWQANAAGTPLRIAYMEYLVEQKQEDKKQDAKKQKQEEKKQEVKTKAPIKGVKNNGAGQKSQKSFTWFD